MMNFLAIRKALPLRPGRGELAQHRHESSNATLCGVGGYEGVNKLYIIHESVVTNVSVCQHRYYII